jgi:hypothetical protein
MALMRLDQLRTGSLLERYPADLKDTVHSIVLECGLSKHEFDEFWKVYSYRLELPLDDLYSAIQNIG